MRPRLTASLRDAAKRRGYAVLPRVLEPEVMDSAEEACDYDAMDHSVVNRRFVDDFLLHWKRDVPILDVGAGTAQIPVLLCTREVSARVVAIDYAAHMLDLAVRNVVQAGVGERLALQRCDAKAMPFATGKFAAVISNSIVHHIPEPRRVFQEMVRVTKPGGLLFVRDLLRPSTDADVRRLVHTYAGDANAHQRQMFEDSLRAALTLDEVRALAGDHGFAADSVRQTTDRHWTWVGWKGL